MKTLDDMFLHFLQDVYYAERQLLRALPKMGKHAESPALKAAFAAHHEETVHQVERIEQVFSHLGKNAKAIPCEAIKGLIEEADDVMSETETGAVRDAGLVACARAVEHYEMARYTSLIAWAKAGGHSDIVALLEQTLAEEKHAEQTLGSLATTDIDKAAARFAKAA